MKSYSHWGMFEVGYWIAEPYPDSPSRGRLSYIHPLDDRYDAKYLHEH